MSRAGVASVLGKTADPRPDEDGPAGGPPSTRRVALWLAFWVLFTLYQLVEYLMPWLRHGGPTHGLAFRPLFRALLLAGAIWQAWVNLAELRRRRLPARRA
jgi:hypothetical protein